MNKGLKILLVIICIFSIIFGITFIGLNVGFNNANKEIELNSEYNISNCSFNWYFLKLKKDVNVTSNVDNTKVGLYNEVCEFRYLYNYKKINEVYVKEYVKPEITLEGNGYVCPGKEYIEEGYKAIDNYDGDITDKVEIVKSDNEYTYKVKDSSNNETIVKREIIYKDILAPKIELVDGDVRLVKGSAYQEKGYKAIDNCLGDITDKVEVISNVDTSKVGEYNITYKVSDGDNTSEVSRKVTIYNPDTREGVIYLTFDDGPNPGTTDYILDILKKYDVKATFFVVPKNDNYFYLIKREYDEGHSIAVHSNTHTYSIVYASDEAFFNDVNAANEKIKNITGSYTYLYRYPGGSSNTVSKNYSKGIVTRTSAKLHELGYHYFDWNISSGDAASVTPEVDTIYNNIVNNLSKNRANVVLMHDVKYNTSRAIERVIQYAKDHGYRFERITMDTKEVHHGIAN